MNSDLKLRLTNFQEADNDAWKFLSRLETRFVAETCPAGYQVEMYFMEIEGDEDDTGYVTLEDKLFSVVLDERLQIGTIHDYMIHEFAHVGTWLLHEEDDHGPMFGVEYARLYRIYLEVYNAYYG